MLMSKVKLLFDRITDFWKKNYKFNLAMNINNTYVILVEGGVVDGAS